MENILVLNTVDSTNDYAKHLAKQGAAHGTAVLAKSQTAGRGRMGRSFLSPEGGLYLSVILRPQRRAEELLALTACLAAAACDAVEEVCHIRPGVKWVNDLILGSKKLAGILTELSLTPDGFVDYAVCGIGINCNTECIAPELREMATSILLETGKTTDIGLLAQAVVRHWSAITDPTVYLRKYRSDCVNLGKPVRVLAAEPYTATAVDVDASGALVVLTQSGEERRISSGEVSVRGLYGYV